MKQLVRRYQNLLSGVQLDFERALSTKINWQARAIGIKGARGTGKSTLMLQHLKSSDYGEKAIYFSLDDLYFKNNTLLETGETFYQAGGRKLFLDEVHKYPDWHREIKNLYDFYPDLQIAFSGSSILELQKSSVDLSRRVLFYELSALSFREFLHLNYNWTFPIYTFEHIPKNHVEIARGLKQTLESPLKFFQEFLTYGSYPFFKEGLDDYSFRLQQIINIIIDYDLPEAKDISVNTQNKLKKLLYVISESVPFTPNISKLAAQIETTRPILLEMLHVLEVARLIRNLRSSTKGISLMNKPEKILLSNANLIKSLSEKGWNSGNIRETFALDQLQNSGTEVTHPAKGDFLLNGEILLEIGGKNKTPTQIIHHENHLVFSDELEIGWGKQIPLYLLGFLY
ncbi:ATP-binding protein [Algoriphagus sp. NG3]|uniref:ATP-binding protein n=1 Tax=Algoriphagus sp. NG3 TaxID=3097546 RepID=UPI002A7F2A42|nr:AAA family ATPase [Algoriphagus sp. NG3]WPR75618.1 AAA family ATPase [Algoriphagus sp. NG3]